MSVRRVGRNAPLSCALVLLFTGALEGCGSDGAASSPTTETAGAAGAASGGGNDGTEGTGSGGSGAAGSAGGVAGAAGASNGGSGGSAGTAGTSGASGPGKACKLDGDCTMAGVETKPALCAEIYCSVGTCQLRARDTDGDGFRAKTCKLLSDGASAIELGGDCDDTEPSVNPKGWDGPAADGQPNHCNDGIDQDCSDTEGDSVANDGASCTCTPGDVANCAETSAGTPITFPGDVPALGSICKLGSRTCVKDVGGTGGKWGPCTGAVAPTIEVCNNADDDCDGQTDEADAQGRAEWVYDADADGYRATLPVSGGERAPFASIFSCAQPNQAPAECDAAYCGALPLVDCCPADKWRLSTATSGLDCDDGDSKVHPDADEVCATPDRDKDDDCNGTKNELPALGAQVWYRDADGDGYGDATTEPKLSCLAPGAGWKTGLVNTDCDDSLATTRPGIAEDCASPQDDNCNGTTHDGCGCTAADPQAVDCGVVGDCNYVANGSTCQGGFYTACAEPIRPKAFCADEDGDEYCNLAKCGSYCETVAPGSTATLLPPKYVLRTTCEGKSGPDCDDSDGSRSPGKTDYCNGQDENCDGIPDNGLGVGTACHVDGKANGACRNGGVWQCQAGNQNPVCVSPDARIGKPFVASPDASPTLEGWFGTPAPNGSFDWDCDGITQVFASPEKAATGVGARPVRPTCGLTPEQICAAAPSFADCTPTGPYGRVVVYAQAGDATKGCACPPDTCDFAAMAAFTCGGALLEIGCRWDQVEGVCAPDTLRATSVDEYSRPCDGIGCAGLRSATQVCH
jgi:hypothetical protein